jgi:hypothetical protein
MSTKRFHELFVDYAVNLTGNYDEQIKDLQHEVKKLKAVIQSMRVQSDVDIDIDGGFHSGYDARGDVDSSIYYDVERGIHQDDMDIEQLDYDSETDKLSIKRQDSE